VFRRKVAFYSGSKVILALRPVKIASDRTILRTTSLSNALARAGYLLTGSARHFPKFWKSTNIVSPRDLLDIVALASHLVE
jgi:hypothetical protein